MKYLLLFFLFLYQWILSPIIRVGFGIKDSCRFPVTCSEYAKEVIRKYGAIKGSYFAVLRLLQCQPFGRIA